MVTHETGEHPPSSRSTPARVTSVASKPPTSTTQKHRPEILEPHGITYYCEAVSTRDMHKLPSHVTMVRDGLLDFDNFLSLSVTTSIIHVSDDDLKYIPQSAYENETKLESWERKLMRSFVKMAKTLSDGAQDMESASSSEPVFQALLKDTVFKQWEGKNPKKYIIPNIANVKDITCISRATTLWNEAHKLRGLDGKHEFPPCPKPDFYFAFPIYDQSAEPGFMQNESFQNFTAVTLFSIKNQLCSTPASGFVTEFTKRASKKDAKIKAHNLVCFPWAIIEIKPFDRATANSQTRVAYCQAANASSTALILLEKLARFAKLKQNNLHVPPVVAVTCIGNQAKVWVAYSCPVKRSRRDHRMQCIWDGNLCKIWDSIQFCRIMENLTSWGRYILRPRISQYISQWRVRYDIASLDPHSAPKEHHSISYLFRHFKTKVGHIQVSRSDVSDLVKLLVITLKEALASKRQTNTEQNEEFSMAEENILLDPAHKNSIALPVPKKRGRPRKSIAPSFVETQIAEDSIVDLTSEVRLKHSKAISSQTVKEQDASLSGSVSLPFSPAQDVSNPFENDGHEDTGSISSKGAPPLDGMNFLGRENKHHRSSSCSSSDSCSSDLSVNQQETPIKKSAQKAPASSAAKLKKVSKTAAKAVAEKVLHPLHHTRDLESNTAEVAACSGGRDAGSLPEVGDKRLLAIPSSEHNDRGYVSDTGALPSTRPRQSPRRSFNMGSLAAVSPSSTPQVVIHKQPGEVMKVESNVTTSSRGESGQETVEENSDEGSSVQGASYEDDLEESGLSQEDEYSDEEGSDE